MNRSNPSSYHQHFTFVVPSRAHFPMLRDELMHDELCDGTLAEVDGRASPQCLSPHSYPFDEI